MISSMISIARGIRDSILPRVKRNRRDRILTDIPDPNFFFVFTQPYSGSTALIKLLNSSPSTMVVQHKGEFQWLIPELSGEKRWDADTPVDYKNLRSTVFDRYYFINTFVNTINTILDKSPSHLVRANQILETFKMARGIVFIRNPYAICGSIFHRRTVKGKEYHGMNPTTVVKEIANLWVKRAHLQKRIIRQHNMELIRYEDFCRDTIGILSQISNICPTISEIDPGAPLVIKDYKKQSLTDMNDMSIRHLPSASLILIEEILQRESELVSFFGYSASIPII